MNRDSERIYDEFLVAAAVTGDPAALSRLVARWQPRLLRHAWRLLGDAERAKDMAQEAWLEILRGLARLDDVAAFPAWAYRITTRRCQREFGRRGHEPLDPDDEDAGGGAMNNVDDLIGRALTEEDRALLASHREPGYVAQAFGLLRGPMAWVMWVAYLAAILAFAGGVYALWQLSDATEAVGAVQWGVASLFLFQVTTMCKSFMGNRMESNRLLRELKRLELQVSLLRDGTGRLR